MQREQEETRLLCAPSNSNSDVEGMNNHKRRLFLEALEARNLLSASAPLGAGDDPNADIAQQVETAPVITAPAFPEAEGFGAQTDGGRGGRVIEVTNLNSEGPGSLREAIEAAGPRIVVFRVAGTIELHKELKITNPHITIAGQSAPGEGITIKNHELSIRTHDVIVRYLRIRIGPTGENDSLSLIGAENVILDHNSFSWATDEVTSATQGSRNITLQWNIISEGLRNSTHPEGAHSMGSLFSGVTNLSLHHNLYAHNDSRNARVGNSDNLYGTQVVDVVNNVFYNWGERATEVRDYVDVNLVGNYYKAGPDTDAAIAVGMPEIVLVGDDIQKSIYVADNFSTIRNVQDDWEFVGEKDGDPVSRQFQSLTRHATPAVTTLTAQAAYDLVLAEAGAKLPARDSVDQRLLAEVQSGAGSIIDDPSEVGGWPILAIGEPPPDSDRDGMPDAWEISFGLNPNDDRDGSLDADGDGYTNMEEWLNNTIPVPPPDAMDDDAAVDEDGSVVINVLANDTPGTGIAFTLTAAGNGSHGAVSINEDQTVTYTPAPNFHGQDVFTYTVMDEKGESHSANVNVVVNAVNDAPAAIGQSVQTIAGVPLSITLAGSDLDQDPLTYAVQSQPEHGALSGTGANLTYTPNAGFVGSDSFTFVVNDGEFDSNPATVNINVAPNVRTLQVQLTGSANDVEQSGSGKMDLDSGDLDAGARPVAVRFEGIDIPQGATILSAYVQFTADKTASAPSDLVVRGEASDQSANFTSEAFNLTSRPSTSAAVNWSVPAWVEDERGAQQRTPDLKAVIQEIVGRGGWSSGNALTIVLEGNTGERAIRSFDDDPNAAATLVIEFGAGPAINAPPTADDQVAFTNVNTPVDITLTGSDPEQDALTFAVQSQPAGGTLTGSGANVTYTPNAGFVGSDSFTFVVSDGEFNSTAATVSIEVGESAADRSIELQTLSGTDDAEERGSGEMDLDSTDLDIGVRPVAVRFSGADIPQGATIIAAYLQFTADESNTAATNLTIAAQAVDDADPFSTANGDITSRPTTNAAVNWSVAEWTIGESGAAQRSPNLASLLQEVVDRDGWSPGNALALIIAGDGTRTAFTHDGDPTHAPKLVVEYKV